MEAKHLALERGGIFEPNQTTIYQTKSEYQSDSAVNPALLWDMIKMKLREKSISCATAKNHKTKFREDILFKEISRLEKRIE